MKKKGHKKSYLVSRDGRITIYPSLCEVEEEGTLRRILKRLVCLKRK